MKTITLCFALSLATCQTVGFQIGYKDAYVGVNFEPIRTIGKNPIPQK